MAAAKRVVTEITPKERWQSTIEGVIWVHKFDRSGRDVEEQVKAGGTIRLLPEERLMNQENAVSDDLDPFLNGFLVPLELVEDSEDFEALKGNPNHLTETDMRNLLKKGTGPLTAAIEDVTNPATLRRFLTLANDPESDARVKDVRAIETRLNQVNNPDEFTEIEQFEGRDVVKTSAPKSSAPANPSAGRRKARD